MFSLSSVLTAFAFAASAAAQGVIIAAPAANTTLAPGQNFTIEVQRPVSHLSVFWNHQEPLTSVYQSCTEHTHRVSRGRRRYRPAALRWTCASRNVHGCQHDRRHRFAVVFWVVLSGAPRRTVLWWPQSELHVPGAKILQRACALVCGASLID